MDLLTTLQVGERLVGANSTPRQKRLAVNLLRANGGLNPLAGRSKNMFYVASDVDKAIARMPRRKD